MAWLNRLLNTFRSNSLQRELDEELRLHLDLRAEELQRNGMDREEARAAAVRKFGNTTLETERMRAMDLAGWMETLIKDLRYALRQFARNPVFSGVAILSLAIGIGANTAIFSVMNAALLKSLPVRDPQQLIMLTNPSASGVSEGMSGGERGLLSYAEYQQLRDHATTLSGLCAVEAQLDRWQVRISGGGQEDARGQLVSENYFSVLGVEPAIGRFFSSDDGKAPGLDPYAVISYDYWQKRFGGNTNVIGTTFKMFSTTLTIIGVAAPGFQGESVGQRPDMWLPMMMQPMVQPGRDWLHEDLSKDIAKVMWLHAIGRLKPGVTLAGAQTEMDVLFRNLIEEGYPGTLSPETRKRVLNQKLKLHDAGTGAFQNRADFSQQLLILLSVAGVVLLIACANIANLLLARAMARYKEVGVRLSIGASRARVVRQFLTESLLLSLLGCVAGLVVAWGAARLLLVQLSETRQDFALNPTLDLRVLGFTLGITVVTGIVFGLVPAIRGTRININESLRESGRGLTSSGAKLNLAKSLVIVGAGLFLRTLWNLQSVDLGYPKEKLLLIGADAGAAGYKDAQLAGLWHEVADRVRAVPGVRGVTYSINGIFSGGESGDEIEVEGFTPTKDNERASRFDLVGPAYFSTVGIPMLRGREIGRQDSSTAPRVCVINESFAKRFFPGRDPVGLHVTERFGDQRSVMEVVGVAKNARDHSLRGEVPPRFYGSFEQFMQGTPDGATVIVRSAADPEQTLAAVRKAILSVDDNIPLDQARPLVDLLERNTAQPRMIAHLCVAFGLVALLLAATGLYGVLSYGVARRTNEIGIRMALGAGRGDVVSMVLRETGVMIAIGVAVGVGLTTAGTRLVATKLYGLGALDPRTILEAVLILAVVALVAGYIPAARAARVNPVKALRHE
ncbi:MAG TPA: ABC transporter permease [Candidatus Limnocylindrales bacterium]|nr:ABC transporter permease [Candidatus Limnocylindrales bacterium]